MDILQTDATLDVAATTALIGGKSCTPPTERLPLADWAISHLMQSMGMDQLTSAKEQKAMETERLVEAFTDAVEGGPSLFRGRRLRMDDMPDEWSAIWNLPSLR